MAIELENAFCARKPHFDFFVRQPGTLPNRGHLTSADADMAGQNQPASSVLPLEKGDAKETETATHDQVCEVAVLSARPKRERPTWLTPVVNSSQPLVLGAFASSRKSQNLLSRFPLLRSVLKNHPDDALSHLGRSGFVFA
jgi:hypothetical protein